MNLHDISKEGDEYVKRLRSRKREITPEVVSRTLQRRISIINSITEKNGTYRNSSISGNPFKTEFGCRTLQDISACRDEKTPEKRGSPAVASQHKSPMSPYRASTLDASKQPIKQESSRAYDYPAAPAGLTYSRQRSSLQSSARKPVAGGASGTSDQQQRPRDYSLSQMHRQYDSLAGLQQDCIKGVMEEVYRRGRDSPCRPSSRRSDHEDAQQRPSWHGNLRGIDETRKLQDEIGKGSVARSVAKYSNGRAGRVSLDSLIATSGRCQSAGRLNRESLTSAALNNLVGSSNNSISSGAGSKRNRASSNMGIEDQPAMLQAEIRRNSGEAAARRASSSDVYDNNMSIRNVNIGFGQLERQSQAERLTVVEEFCGPNNANAEVSYSADSLDLDEHVPRQVRTPSQQPQIFNARPNGFRGRIMEANKNEESRQRDTCQVQPDLLPEIERMSNGSFEAKMKNSGGRLSFSEYFADPTVKVENMEAFTDQAFEEEFARGNAELQRQGPDRFFSARVLEVLEPTVTPSKILPKKEAMDDRTYVQVEYSDESCAMSFRSEDIRDLDREIDKLQLYPDLEDAYEQEINESRYQAPQTPNKPHGRQLTGKRIADLRFGNNQHLEVEASSSALRRASEVPEIFGTPMPITNSQLELIRRRHTDGRPAKPGVKRNFSSFFRGLFGERPAHLRHRPAHESTRHIASSHASPISNFDSTISTITNTPSTCNDEASIAGAAAKTCDSTALPEEVQNFLHNALGNKHYISTTTFDHSIEKNNKPGTSVNLSEMKSMYQTADSSRNESHDFIPVRHGALSRSRALSKLKTLSQRIKKKIRKSLKQEAVAQSELAVEANISPNLQERVQALRSQVEIQQTLVHQASKALALCYSMPEFMTSVERVESERALVLANLRNQAYLDEIVRLTTLGRPPSTELWRPGGPPPPGPGPTRSELKLTELSLRLREDVLRRERHGDELVEWFLVVVSEGQRVWASRPVLCSRSAARLYFPDHFDIAELASDFRLLVQVFSLRLRQQVNYDHADRYHLPGSSSSRGPSSGFLANHLLRRSRRATGPGHRLHDPAVNISAATKNSSFVECGSLELSLRELRAPSNPWSLNGVPARSVLHGSIDFKLQSNLSLQSSHAGFVTFGEEIRGTVYWTLYYCVLEDQWLKFWNYPPDRDNCVPPKRTIDLGRCASRGGLVVLERSLCPRPHTLLVPTARRRESLDLATLSNDLDSNYVIVRYFLSFDKPDLEEWQTKINYVVNALREWKMIVDVRD